MHKFVRGSYHVLGKLSRAAVRVAPPLKSKLMKAMSSRRGIVERYESWAQVHRDLSRPLLWFHAPSVGEGLQALPVISGFRENHPEFQIVYTYFSPSAERFADRVRADFTDYLPFDNEADSAGVIDAIKPDAIIFSKLDVWPMLVECASQRHVKLGLLSATVPESSGRRSRLALLALREAYEALDLVGAISPSDAERLLEMGVRGDRMTITGDTRYDQVWARANAPSEARDAVIARYSDSRPTLVAGSTWPSDEKRLLAAWLHMRKQVGDARLIIAPHELSKSHLDAIVKWAKENSLSLSRTSDADVIPADVLLVDQYGILGDIYAIADVAYVGGGFHDAGLHSLLEPAAFGAPVLFGPMHTDNRDANLLIGGGGGMRCGAAGDISARLLAWFRNESVRRKAGACARRVVQGGIGAAEKSVELLESLLLPA
jgi:3-deoxy-D-manno-octulosonic-acid transferase